MSHITQKVHDTVKMIMKDVNKLHIKDWEWDDVDALINIVIKKKWDLSDIKIKCVLILNKKKASETDLMIENHIKQSVNLMLKNETDDVINLIKWENDDEERERRLLREEEEEEEKWL